jgi:hypothetical protein
MGTTGFVQIEIDSFYKYFRFAQVYSSTLNNYFYVAAPSVNGTRTPLSRQMGTVLAADKTSASGSYIYDPNEVNCTNDGPPERKVDLTKLRMSVFVNSKNYVYILHIRLSGKWSCNVSLPPLAIHFLNAATHWTFTSLLSRNGCTGFLMCI